MFVMLQSWHDVCHVAELTCLSGCRVDMLVMLQSCHDVCHVAELT